MERLKAGGRHAFVATVLLVITACGGDEDSVKTATLARYCDLSSQLEQAAASTGAASAPGTFDGAPEAIGRLMAQVESTSDELNASAPKEIRSDVKTITDALRKAKTGDVSDLRSPEFASASGKVKAFRSRSCSAGATGGDG